MGISFVSKVAPPKYKGLMMGCWFGATAIGNYLVFIPALLWNEINVALLWGILIVVCLLSAGLIFRNNERSSRPPLQTLPSPPKSRPRPSRQLKTTSSDFHVKKSRQIKILVTFVTHNNIHKTNPNINQLSCQKLQ